MGRSFQSKISGDAQAADPGFRGAEKKHVEVYRAQPGIFGRAEHLEVQEDKEEYKSKNGKETVEVKKSREEVDAEASEFIKRKHQNFSLARLDSAIAN